MILDKRFNFFAPQFSHKWNGENNSTHYITVKGLNRVISVKPSEHHWNAAGSKLSVLSYRGAVDVETGGTSLGDSMCLPHTAEWKNLGLLLMCVHSELSLYSMGQAGAVSIGKGVPPTVCTKALCRWKLAFYNTM